MPTILRNKTNKPRVDPMAEPRNVLGLKLTNGIKHSPDGYFAHDEALARAHRMQDAASIRTRSKTHIGHGHGHGLSDLQDVTEEEDAANPHAWRKPARGDSRSVCPALNTLANHAYLPRDGHDIGVWSLVQAMVAGYGTSYILAIAFTIGSFIILRLGGVGKGWLRPTIDLRDLSAHGVLEHDGSLVHADAHEPYDPPETSSRSRSTSAASSTIVSTTPAKTRSSLISYIASLLFPRPEHNYLPCRPSRSLIKALLADSASGTHLTLQDVARARVRRCATSPPVPRHLAQFADAEFVLVLGIFGKKGEEPRMDLDMLEEWLTEERFPRGWRPDHTLGFWENHLNINKVQALMAGLRKYKQKTRNVQSVVYE